MEVGPIVLDTNRYVAFKRGDSDAIEIIKRTPAIIINPIIMGELLCGFALGNREERNKKELELFLSSERVQFFNINKETGGYYSKIYRDLRSKGKPIPTNDIWIAATAMQYSLSIFSCDKHFGHISDLRVISKLEDLIETPAGVRPDPEGTSE